MKTDVIIFFFAPACSLSVGAHLLVHTCDKFQDESIRNGEVMEGEANDPPAGSEEPPKGSVLIRLTLLSYNLQTDNLYISTKRQSKKRLKQSIKLIKIKK